MMWALRFPSGLFFTALGVILCLTAWLVPDARPRLTSANVNLWSGVIMLIFGGILLWMSRRAN